MMTRSEAIRILEDGEWRRWLDQLPCESDESKQLHEALNLAIEALKRVDLVRDAYLYERARFLALIMGGMSG